MISKPILYYHVKSDTQPYKAEFYFHPLRLLIKLPLKFGKWLFEKWQPTRKATGKTAGADKIVISHVVAEFKPYKEFIERMRAQGYKVETTETEVTITGEKLTAKIDEIKKDIENYCNGLVVNNKQT